MRLVTRQAHPADRRSTLIETTSAGRLLFARMAPVHAQWVEELMAGLTPAEASTLYQLLGKFEAVCQRRRLIQDGATMDPADLTATAARAQMAAGMLTPEALMEACLARIASREAVLQAMAFLDPALARSAAASARPGPLHGLPLGVKDVLDTADLPTGYNSPIWQGHRPRGGCRRRGLGACGGRRRAGQDRDHRIRHPASRANH